MRIQGKSWSGVWLTDFGSGLGQSMLQVILGRVISGAGSSGMTVLVSILITGECGLLLVPWARTTQKQWYLITFTRSCPYTRCSSMAFVGEYCRYNREKPRRPSGRMARRCNRLALVRLSSPSCWTPAVLANSALVNARRSFLGQTPVVGFALILCAICLPASTPNRVNPESGDGSSKSAWQQLHRIDFRGAFLFGAMILAFLVPAELGGDHLPWSHPLIAILFASSLVLLLIFVAVEKRTEEPIIPLEIFHNRDAVLSYVILGLQGAAQIGVCTPFIFPGSLHLPLMS